MTDADTLTEHAREFHNEFVRVWVWGLTLIIAALTLVIFSELAKAGIITDAQIAGMRPVISLIGIIGAVGFALYAAPVTAEALAYLNEVDR